MWIDVAAENLHSKNVRKKVLDSNQLFFMKLQAGQAPKKIFIKYLTA